MECPLLWTKLISLRTGVYIFTQVHFNAKISVIEYEKNYYRESVCKRNEIGKEMMNTMERKITKENYAQKIIKNLNCNIQTLERYYDNDFIIQVILYTSYLIQLKRKC